ncbi:MAG: hypothetical protein KJN72_00195 [Woeseia sp.]|nr:hypothetical protein [Woeseia sp.]
MPKKTDAETDERDVVIADADANVDKIRDILFGGQMRDYEKRFAALEKRLSDSIERTARDMEKRLDRLDSFTRKEFEKLSEQLKAERKERGAESKQSAAELAEYADQVEGWFAEVEEQLSEETKGLRATLDEQSAEASGQLREVQTALQKEIDREAGELANQKIAREDLAALLTEMALRLKKDFKLPKA